MSQYLCFSCFYTFNAPRWEGCTRCGTHACLGLCEHLRWLTSASSLYPYIDHHRGLLLAAKDLQCFASMTLFEAVYSDFMTQALSEIILKKRVDIIVLARLRLPRLASAQWHPTEVWRKCIDRVLTQMHQRGEPKRDIPILMFPSMSVRKRSRVDAFKRRKLVLAEREVVGSSFLAASAAGQKLNVLLLDDVLTSGGSLKFECETFQKVMGESTELCFHALTLFRTPVSVMNQEETMSDELAKPL